MINEKDLSIIYSISLKLGKKLDLADIVSAMCFKNYLQSLIQDQNEVERVFEQILKAPESKDDLRDSGSNVFNYILDLITHDKKYSRFNVIKVYEFISETLGTSHDDFSNFCRSSKKLTDTFLSAELEVTELEKIFSMFYCMTSVLEKNKNLNVPDQLFFNEFVAHLGLVVENSDVWIDFRTFEDSFEQFLKDSVESKAQRVSFLGILAAVMGGDLEFDTLEKKVLQKYFYAFDLKVEDVRTLKDRGDIKVAELFASLNKNSYPALVFGIIESMLADGKIGSHETEILKMILEKKNEFTIHSSLLLKLYYEVLKANHQNKGLGEVDLAQVNELFSNFNITSELRAQLFYLTETYVNVRHGMEFSEKDLQTSLLHLGFSEELIPELVDVCKKDLNGTSHRVKNLAFIECLYCLKESSGANTEFLRELLMKMIKGSAVNKKNILEIVLTFMIFKRNNLDADIVLFEDICNRLKIYKDEIKEVLFYFSLTQGKVVGKEIAFRE